MLQASRSLTMRVTGLGAPYPFERERAGVEVETAK